MQAESGGAAGGAPTRPARRTVLGGILATGVGVVAGGCSSDREPGPDGASPTPTPDPDAALVATVIQDKRAILARYAATAARFPGLAARLAPLRDDHLGHLEALHAGPEPEAAPGATATPAPAPGVPADRKAAARALARAEQSAAGRRVPQCVLARSPDLALLLASIGGCEGAHGLVLDQLADTLPAATADKPRATAQAKP